MSGFVSAEAVDFWNARAGEWAERSEHDPFYARRIQLIAELVSRHGAGRLLEVGCASGGLTRLLLERGVDAWGYDIAEAMIERAAIGSTAGRLRAAPDGTIPFAGLFQTIVAVGVFPYVTSHRAFALHLRERLEPGGVLIASSTNRLSLYTVVEIARQLPRPRADRAWLRVIRNLVCTGVWSGGFVPAAVRAHSTNARRFDAMMAEVGLSRISAVDLFNVAALDRHPLSRGVLSAALARLAGWTHIGVWRADQCSTA